MRQGVFVSDYSRGVDLVSNPAVIEEGFSPASMNFRLADGPGIEKVLGYGTTASPHLADLTDTGGHELTYFQATPADTKFLVAATPTKWKSITVGGTVTNIRTTATAANTTFASYNGVLYGLDPGDVMHSWTGSGSTSVVGGSPPQGIILGVWSNRLWVAAVDGGILKTIVRWSDAGNFASWPVGNTVTLGGAGVTDQIVGGQPLSDGLMVFCKNSTFLIYDTDGANRIVDPQYGCKSRKSLSVVDGFVYGVNDKGVFRTNGGFPLEIVSRRVDPLFTFENPTLTDAAGVAWNRGYLLSYNRNTGNAYNDLTLDVYPVEGSIMINQYRSTCWAAGPLPASGDQALYFIDAGNTRYVRTAFSSGAFLTTASPGVATDISCYYETAPLDLGSDSYLKRINLVRLVGRGDIYVGAKVDYQDFSSVTDRFEFPAIGGGVWDTALWDTDTWAGYALFEGYARLRVRGRRIALRFYESSQNVEDAKPVLDYASTADLGGAGIYNAEILFNASSKRRQSS